MIRARSIAAAKPFARRVGLGRLCAALLLAGLLAGCVQPVTAVDPGRVYRSGQLTSKELRDACEELHIKTVINLRQSQSSARREEKVAAGNGTRVVHLPMDQNTPPTPEEQEAFFDIMDKPVNYPVLIHCAHGKDRTGVMVAMYRIRYQGWSPTSAYKEMESYGHNPWMYGKLKPFVLGLGKAPAKPPRAAEPTPPSPPRTKRPCPCTGKGGAHDPSHPVHQANPGPSAHRPPAD